MSDIETTEEVETPAASAEEGSSAPAPWGDDFNPERAWSTIQHQRAREAELEPLAKTFQRLESGEDSETFAKLAEKYGYELPEVEDEPDEWEDPTNQEIAQLKKQLAAQEEWRQQVETERQITAFQNDLASFSREKGVELSERQVKFILAAAASDPKGLSRTSTKAAFDDLVSELEAYEQGLITKHGIRPKAARQPIRGQAASQNKDLDPLNISDLASHLARRVSDGNE